MRSDSRRGLMKVLALAALLLLPGGSVVGLAWALWWRWREARLKSEPHPRDSTHYTEVEDSDDDTDTEFKYH